MKGDGMSNVVQLSAYRESVAAAERSIGAATAAQLTVISYDALLDWCGADFSRLVAAAQARDYRPEWISHQLENHGRAPTPREAEILTTMIVAAGPYLSPRLRWIMRHVRTKPMTTAALVKLATAAKEYRDYKHVDRCVEHDIGKLEELGLVRRHGAKVVAVTPSEGMGVTQRISNVRPMAEQQNRREMETARQNQQGSRHPRGECAPRRQATTALCRLPGQL